MQRQNAIKALTAIVEQQAAQIKKVSARCVADVAMAQEVLNEPRISTFVCEGEASAVPEHVGMNFYGQLGALPTSAQM